MFLTNDNAFRVYNDNGASFGKTVSHVFQKEEMKIPNYQKSE